MTEELISKIADVAVACAALGTFTVALVGLKSWRREMTGRTEYDLARRVLRACLKVRDAFWYVRNPLSWIPREASLTREGVAKHSIDEFHTRWTVPSSAMEGLEVELLEAEVIWGSLLANSRINMRKCIGHLQMSVEEYIENLRSGDQQLTQAEHKRLRKDVYAVPGSADELSSEMRDIISEFEGHLRPRLKH